MEGWRRGPAESHPRTAGIDLVEKSLKAQWFPSQNIAPTEEVAAVGLPVLLGSSNDPK
jgi:hypothetical protein